MELLLAKTAWEVYDWPLARIAARAASDGFTALELYIADRPESPDNIRAILDRYGLQLIAQITTTGPTPADHVRSLKLNYLQAVACNPLSINCHTGRDHFPFEENLALFHQAEALVAQYGVRLHHETHRGRALFCGPATLDYLSEIPSLELTADLSHWCCAHESDLGDQPEAVAAVIAHATHIHARVGHAQGPQVVDPSSPDAQPWLEKHLAWWHRIAAARRASGAPVLTISPEFGPPPYQPVIPGSGCPPTEPWRLNVWMRDYLQKQMGEPAA